MSAFARVGKAEAFGRGNYFPNLAMTYLVVVTSAKVVNARSGQTFFVLETEVKKILVGSTHGADGKLNTDSEGRSAPQAGEQRNWMCCLTNDAGPADMRGFLELVWTMLDREGEPSDKDIEELGDLICDEKEQPLTGTVFKLATYNRKTKKGGNFTIHNWSKPTEADLAAVAA